MLVNGQKVTDELLYTAEGVLIFHVTGAHQPEAVLRNVQIRELPPASK